MLCLQCSCVFVVLIGDKAFAFVHCGCVCILVVLVGDKAIEFVHRVCLHWMC